VTITSRSYSLVDGFLSAFDSWNVIVAAPIVRMQIDNLVRLAYAATVNSDELSRYMVMGGELRKQTDAEGKSLTDARLVQLAHEAGHEWAPDVYRATSGWVHLSPELLHAVVQFEDRSDDEEELQLTAGFGIPIPRKRIPLRPLEELLGAMTQATEEIFGYIEVWESRKGLPLGQARDLTSDSGP